MFERKVIVSVLLALLTLSTLTLAQAKRRIAILDFDYSTSTNSQVLLMYGSVNNLSKDLSDLLVNRLQQLGTYELVERQMILAVLKEQNFGASGRVDETQATKIGELLGAQGVLVGSIKSVTFSPPKRSRIVDKWKKKIPIIGDLTNLPLKDARASVAITFRLVNATKGTIVVTGDYIGEASDKKPILNPAEALGVDSTDQEVAKFLLRGAINDVVSKVALQVEQYPTALPEPTIVRAATKPEAPKPANVVEEGLTGKVAKVEGSRLIINIGQNRGVKVGDRFDVKRVEAITRPKLHRDGYWFADYRRLRFTAVKRPQ